MSNSYFYNIERVSLNIIWTNIRIWSDDKLILAAPIGNYNLYLTCKRFFTFITYLRLEWNTIFIQLKNETSIKIGDNLTCFKPRKRWWCRWLDPRHHHRTNWTMFQGRRVNRTCIRFRLNNEINYVEMREETKSIILRQTNFPSTGIMSEDSSIYSEYDEGHIRRYAPESV